MDYPLTSQKIEDFIYHSVEKAGARGIVLGLSGGVDSAVVATLSTRALGSDNVLGLIMPSPSNQPHDIDDANLIARHIEINTKIISLKPMIEAFQAHLEHDRLAMGNLTARIRMSLLYYEANHLNYLVAGTGNKSERIVGYFTKYGDGGCDMLPIGDLLKTQVWELARFLGVPQRIIDRVPTASLWPGQTDEGDLGISYEELDKILEGKKDNLKIQRMINASEHKRKPPEVCRI